ncbi:MAG: hypothetical protein HY064_01900 [Bacteroidetes bacterium]|nr:hypothetical protein [Bacteroidota bacterium]
MKRTFFPIVIAVIVLVTAGAVVLWVFFSKEREFQKIEIPGSYLELTDSSRFALQPILIVRKFPDDSILVLFPGSENHSQVFLYDQKNYNRLLFGDHKGEPVIQSVDEGLSALMNRKVINLSNYKSGKYYVHATACNFGGFLELELLDSNK